MSNVFFVFSISIIGIGETKTSPDRIVNINQIVIQVPRVFARYQFLLWANTKRTILCE